MKVVQLTEHLRQVNRYRFVNCYLVEETDGLTLIDTGLGGAADRLIAVAATGAPIKRIALTHGHADHAGSLDALCARLGDDVDVAVGEADAKVWRASDGDRPRGSWQEVQTKPGVLLAGGERIGSLDVIASPGHTAGHMAFLDTRDGTLIAGDVFTTSWRTEIPNRLRQPFPFAAMGTDDRVQIVATARALAALAPTMLAVGHGPAVSAPGKAIAAAIRRAAQ